MTSAPWSRYVMLRNSTEHMQDTFTDFRSIPGIVDVMWYPPRGASEASPARTLLIEVPHGATRRSDYETLEAQLVSKLPQDLIEFFFVNTDIGTPEGAECIARALATAPAGQSLGVLVLRCLLPRTFIDTNRVVAASPSDAVVDGITPALASYVTAKADHALLLGLHQRYHELVARAYAAIPGRGGLALQLHSYSPRSVGIDKIDQDIVAALREAYEPGVYETWPKRPAVDLITADTEGRVLASPEVVVRLREEYARIGIEAKENETYRLMPSTMGYQYADRYPGHVTCIEINRELLADPFIAFADSPIGAAKVERMVGPLILVLGEARATAS
jgi:N-formylglutamate amidohydrolase